MITFIAKDGSLSRISTLPKSPAIPLHFPPCDLKPLIAYFISHPNQYHSPMLRHLAEQGFRLHVFYNTTDGATEYFDPGFNQSLTWDVPLLEGYSFTVLASHGFWNQLRECSAALQTSGAGILWIHGWGCSFTRAAWLAGWRERLPVMLRGEASLPCVKGGPIRRAAHKLLFSFWFRFVDRFLAIGSANQQFYQAYGVPSEKISLTPYAVDNEFFRQRCARAEEKTPALRTSLHLRPDQKVALFVGRLIPEKAVDVLLRAWQTLQDLHLLSEPPVLVLAGDGPLQQSLELSLSPEIRPFVRFAGFLNQTQLPSYYALCDALILPSRFEPWGVVVNEAMNAGKPVILSDVVGSGQDLVVQGKNGVIFPSGNAPALAKAVAQVFGTEEIRRTASTLSREQVEHWDFDAIAQGLEHALSAFPPSPAAAQDPAMAEGNIAQDNSHEGGVFLAYSGFHEIPQMALAAHEAGLLDAYYCTVYSGAGTWGSAFSRVRNIVTVDALGGDLIPPAKVIENPWPVVVRQLGNRMGTCRPGTPWDTSRWFGQAAAAILRRKKPALVVGAESCSETLFEAAKRQGAMCLLDCHGIPVPFLEATMNAAAGELGLPPPAPRETQDMSRSKERERELADIIVLCSALQRDLHAQLGTPAEKLRAVPLWVDTNLWHTKGRPVTDPVAPLKVLFAGAGILAKGLPYLLLALQPLGDAVTLTIVGNVSPDMQPFLNILRRPPDVIPYAPKSKLREQYWSHDILVMPSLGDSFGFVAIEAMACGMPVIATDHCGVPLPSPDWRVPARSSTAITSRIQWYLNDFSRVGQDSAEAASFAASFPPSKYRAQIREIYAELLAHHR